MPVSNGQQIQYDIPYFEDQCADVLAAYPQTRNDDAILAVFVWWKFYNEELIYSGDKKSETTAQKGQWLVPLERISFLPSESDISRVRRKLNEQGQFLATDSIVIARRAKQAKVEKEINSPNWDKIFT